MRNAGQALIALTVVVLGGLAWACARLCFDSEYIVFQFAGTDRTGQYRIYRSGPSVVLTRDKAEFFQATANGYAKRINRPDSCTDARLRFNPSLFEGPTMYELYGDEAKLTSLANGELAVWVGHADGSHELVKFLLATVH